MKSITHVILLVFIAVLIFNRPLPGAAQGNKQNYVTGNWAGTLDLSGFKVEMIFVISQSVDGKLTAKMAIPSQGALGIRVDKVVTKNDSLYIDVPSIRGDYKGKFSESQTFEGKWTQRGISVPLILKKTEKVSGLSRPQTPEKPYPYNEEEVVFQNQRDGIKLTGTLTLPKGNGKFPAAVLITGSGAQDRDETIYGHKPFLVLADYLTRHGIAVLRADDRGVGGSGGNIRDATIEELGRDVIAAVDLLKSQKQIIPDKIGLIGHSEGGIVAPLVANFMKDIAFVVLWAAPGIVGEHILYQQGVLLNKATGLSETQIQNNYKMQNAIFSIIKNEEDSAQRIEKLQNVFSNGIYESLNKEQKKAIDQQIETVNTPWFKFFLSYNPYPALMKLQCPVLALAGEKDLQVPSKSNLEAIEKALIEGGHQNYKVMELENLNHLFQNCETGGISEYGQIEETISPDALKVITSWILETVK